MKTDTNRHDTRLFPLAKTLGVVAILAAVLSGCKTQTPMSGTDNNSGPQLEIVKAPAQTPLGGKRALPFAVIYRTNGNYDNHVIAQYDRATDTFISFPAPTDVAETSAPLQLVDGWLLDRRGGVSLTNTVFLRWTYAEYHRLEHVPTLNELRDAILPDAKVTAVQRLDMTTYEAQRDTAAVNALIRSNEVRLNKE